MTDEEIMVFAKNCFKWNVSQHPADLISFARAIAKSQREKDAEICLKRNTRYVIPFIAVEECAAAILASD